MHLQQDDIDMLEDGNEGPEILQNDPGSLEEEERQDHREAAQAEELRVHAAAFANFSQPNHSLTVDGSPGTSIIPTSQIESMQVTLQFIEEIRSATLDNSNLYEAVIERLHNPEKGLIDISDPDVRLSLNLFMATTNASEETYKAYRQSILHCYPESQLLSLYSVKKLVG